MPAVILDRESTAWRHQEPVWLTARLNVDWDMIKRTVKGVRIADLSSLWPYNHFRDSCIAGAKAWLHDMKIQNQHYELIGNETDIKVWAPLRPRDQFDIAVGTRADAFPFPRGKADILFGAHFRAKYASTVEVP